jgi:DNA-binding GntR family transcriptional regulator
VEAGHQSTVDELAGRIGGAIMTGELPIGTWLRQQTLAELYGVSRQPVREALRQVQAAGLVEIHPHRGAIVRGPSPEEIREAYLVRAELEGLAAELATARIDAAGLAALREAQDAFQQAVSGTSDDDVGDLVYDHGWSFANDRFHEVVISAGGVRFLREMILAVYRTVPRNLTWSAIPSRAELARNVEQHEAVRLAIEARDAPRARAAMREHIRRSGELIARHIERQH